MGNTSIEWTDKTWNPTRGCSRVSAGCTHCYAERQAARFAEIVPSDTPGGGIAGPFYGFVTKINGHPSWTGKVELIESKILEPLSWRKPARVFVNSMSDLFHEALPDEAVDRVFAVMALTPHITYQILTKRPKRMREYVSGQQHGRMCRVAQGIPVRGEKPNAPFPLPNVWLGVSAEDQKTADERIPLLLKTPSAVRFVSHEPALGPVDFVRIHCGAGYTGNSLHGAPIFGVPADAMAKRPWPAIDWVIVGGESGPGARPFDISWARNTIQQCNVASVACFVKQLGSQPYEKLPGDMNAQPLFPELNDRKGGNMDEWPEDLRVREFPK